MLSTCNTVTTLDCSHIGSDNQMVVWWLAVCCWKALPIDCADNGDNARYVYMVTVYTGSRIGAGTTSKVYLSLYGELSQCLLMHHCSRVHYNVTCIILIHWRLFIETVNTLTLLPPEPIILGSELNLAERRNPVYWKSPTCWPPELSKLDSTQQTLAACLLTGR